MADFWDEANPYYDPHRLAGEEVSSTGEGRHILIGHDFLLFDDSIHVLVQKGMPVAFYDGVGIALKTAQSSLDVIPVDTEGIWRVPVYLNIGALPGMPLYMNNDGIVTDLFDVDVAWAVFGYAMQGVVVDNPKTVVIAVKVHWMWAWWWYIFEPPWGEIK